MHFMRSWSRASVPTLLIIILFLTGCTGKTPEVPASTAILTDTPSAPAPTKPGIEETPEPQDEDTIEAPESTGISETQETTQEAQPTPAPTLTDWREAPISPEEVSQHVIEIYQDGQQQGRDPHSFSVIGDCQAIPFVFMGPYGRGDLEPDAAESQLWNVINTFDASFKRWSVTARGGFTAASLLNPLQADPDSCKPGESPLTCEFRLNNPAFVFVTLETWLEPETVDRYEGYLRQILDYVIERGTVPILLTKADASELRGVEHVINPAIVNLAYEYQLPVVNFWRSAQYLDNFGIDPGREGFHLSDAGYNLKNTLALRALYQVWTAVEGIETAEAVAPTPTGTPEPTPMPEVVVRTIACETGCVFFGTAQSNEGTVQGGGVYAYEPETKQLTQILGVGFDLQDVSDDGRRLLVNQSNRLYITNLEDGSNELVTEGFYDYGKQGAYWNSDESEVIYLDQSSPLETTNGQGFNLLPSGKDGVLVFESGRCPSKDYCQSDGVFRRDDGGEITKLDTIASPVYAPDGSWVAYLNPEAATAENFYHTRYLVLEDTALGESSRRVLYFPEVSGFMVYGDVQSTVFSQNSQRVFILYDVYSEYYEYSLRLETFLYDLETGIRYDTGELEGISGSLTPQVVWAPDGESVLFFLTDLSETGEYSISVYRTVFESGEQLVLFDETILSGMDYLYLTNLYWR
ncbi:MAG: SGNH/GDSL hydrolase family protein [Chloroflexota bacterium]|nr:SGNH/GDSL hydrolase family protein [Chloroflexota bacterium]